MCFILGIQPAAETTFASLWGCGSCSSKAMSLNHQTKQKQPWNSREVNID